MTVERVRVGDVLSLQRREAHIDPLVDYRLIGVYSFGKGIFRREPKPGSELGDYRFFAVEPGDLVLSNIQAWEGAIAFASQQDAEMIGTHRFLSYTAATDRIDTNWARWFFLSEPGMRLIRQAAPGTTARNRTLAIDRFEALEIPLPPIDDQRRVAEGLDRLEAAAAGLKHLSSRASALSSALAVSVATRPDLNGDAKVRIGWRRTALGTVVSLNNHEVVVRDDTSYDVAGVYSFGRGMLRRASLDGSQTSYKLLHRLRADQLVMSRLKAWEGALALVPRELEGCFLSPEFPTFDIDPEKADVQFLGVVLTSEQFWSRLKGASRGVGARRERVNASRLLEQEVMLPPLERQRSAMKVLQRASTAPRRERSRERINALVPAALNQVFASLT